MTEQTTTRSGRSLEERLDSTAEAWKPKPNEKLVGRIIDVDSRETEYGVYPILTLETESGDEIAVHCFHTVLKNELSKRRPRIGERLGIKYLGKQPGGYEGYRVAWEDTPDPDWQRIGAEAEAEAATGAGPAEELPFDGEEPPVVDDDVPF